VNKNKRKYRFNIIDVLLLLVIVASLSGIVFLVVYDTDNIGAENNDKKVEIMYTLEARNVKSILRGKINIGDSVFKNEGKLVLGQVIDVEYTDSVYTGYDPVKKEQFEASYPGHIDMRVRISVSATVDDNGIYRVGGDMLNIGENMSVRFPFYTGEYVCISISEVNE